MKGVSTKSLGMANQPEAQTAAPLLSARPLFRDLYAEHAGFLFRVLRGMGVAEASVEDAAQDVFMVVHRRLPEFDGRHKLRTWLFEIAFRTACSYRRKQRTGQGHADQLEQLIDRSADPAESLAQRDQLQAVSRVLDRLDDNKRVVLILADMEELSVPEIAELIQVPINTVYTRLRRARSEFSSAWASAQRRQT